MKTINQLVVIGATIRLEEVNREAEHLKKIIEKYSEVKELVIPPKKKHWTQTKAGRERMRQIQLNRNK